LLGRYSDFSGSATFDISALLFKNMADVQQQVASKKTNFIWTDEETALLVQVVIDYNENWILARVKPC
jgi:hypothetical protein